MQYFERNWFLFCVLKCKTVWRPVYCVASSGDRDIVPLLLKHDLTCRMIIDRIFFYHFWFLIHCFFFLSVVWMLTSLVSFCVIRFLFHSLLRHHFYVFLFLTASHYFHSWFGIRDYLCLFLYVLIISVYFASFHSLFFNIITHQYVFFIINVTMICSNFASFILLIICKRTLSKKSIRINKRYVYKNGKQFLFLPLHFFPLYIYHNYSCIIRLYP